MLDIAQNTQRLSALHCIRGGVLKGHRVPGNGPDGALPKRGRFSFRRISRFCQFLADESANRAPLATNK